MYFLSVLSGKPTAASRAIGPNNKPPRNQEIPEKPFELATSLVYAAQTIPKSKTRKKPISNTKQRLVTSFTKDLNTGP